MYLRIWWIFPCRMQTMSVDSIQPLDKVLQERYKLKIELVNFQAEFREDFSNPELAGWENETLYYFQTFQTAKNSQVRYDLKAKIKYRVLP